MADSKVAVHFTPLYGVHGQHAVSYLLQVGACRLLLDCGWTDSLTVEELKPLEAVADTIDAVLISHASMKHMGALPYLVSKLHCKAHIYSTQPVNRMGAMILYDAILSRKDLDKDFSSISLDDVDTALKSVAFGGTYNMLRFYEEAVVKDVTVSAAPAGCSLGGTMWHITKSSEVILYAMDYNHKNDRLLMKTPLATMFKHPSLVITNVTSPHPAAFRLSGGGGAKDDTDKGLANRLLAILRKGGHVLLPSQTAGRSLELLIRLEGVWPTAEFPLVYLTPVATNTLEFAKTMLEYMNDKLTREFTETRHVPFDFEGRVRVITSMAAYNEFMRTARTPAAVIASFPSLEIGFSRALFMSWHANSHNTVVFTDRGDIQPGSAAAQLLSIPTPAVISLQQLVEVPLTGMELRKYRETQDEERRKALRAAETAKRMEEEKAELSELRIPSVSATEGASHGETISLAKYPMFNWDDRESRLGWSDYGQDIIVDDFIDKNAVAKAVDTSVESTGTSAASASPQETGERIPTKLERRPVYVSIACSVQYIDLEGKSDPGSIRNILEEVAPLHLVIVNSDASTATELADACSSHCGKVSIARCNETVDASSNTAQLVAKLRDSLYPSLQFHKVGGYEVTYLDSEVAPGSDIMLTHSANPTPGHDAVLLRMGPLRIPEIRKRLAKQGIESEMVGGALVTKSGIIIQRATNMALGYGFELEGPPTLDYFAVRKVLYDLYTLV